MLLFWEFPTDQTVLWRKKCENPEKNISQYPSQPLTVLLLCLTEIIYVPVLGGCVLFYLKLNRFEYIPKMVLKSLE